MNWMRKCLLRVLLVSLRLSLTAIAILAAIDFALVVMIDDDPPRLP